MVFFLIKWSYHTFVSIRLIDNVISINLAFFLYCSYLIWSAVCAVCYNAHSMLQIDLIRNEKLRVIRQKIRFPNCETCNSRGRKKSLALHFEEMHFDYCFQSNQTDPYRFSISIISVTTTVTFHLTSKWTCSVWTDEFFRGYNTYFIRSSYLAK